MRFICLTSITMESHSPESEIDYFDIKSADRRYTLFNEAENPCSIQAEINKYKKYSVTDVGIECLENVCDDDIRNFVTDVGVQPMKYVLDEDIQNTESQTETWWFTFERDKMLFEIKMMPGTVIVKEVDRVNYVMKFKFPKNPSQNFPIWISEVCLRFLNISNKNRKHDGFIRNSYKAFLNTILQYAEEQNCDEEEAVEKVERPEENESDKVMKQRITDIKNAITDLCKCPTGTIPKIPENARYRGRSYWQTFQSITITTRKEYHERKNKDKNRLILLEFNSVEISLSDAGWFKCPTINDLLYINVEIKDTSIEAWTKFAQCISKLSILLTLRISGDLEDIPDIVFQKLPNSIMNLNLAFNRLTKISPYISRLTDLKNLYLDNNPFLCDEGMPWKSLPERIETLSCVRTGLKLIPEDIQLLINMKTLKLLYSDIQFIPWSFVNRNIQSIFGTFNDLSEINGNNFPHLELLDIRNAKIEWSPNHTQLHTLFLANCGLKEFFWENIPPNLSYVNLSGNLFKTLDSMEYWIKLDCLDLSYNQISLIKCCDIQIDNVEDIVIQKLDLNLSDNQIHSLPLGFENCTQIAELNLSKNKFAYENIEETLWNRLPKSLQSLTVDGLDIRKLPCILKNLPLKDLSASGCNLHYICPQLSRHCQPFLFIDISDNKFLKNLPFTPKTVLPPPIQDGSANFEHYDLQEKWYNFGGNVSHPIKVFTDKSYQSENEFIWDEQKLLNLNFKKTRNVKKTQEYFCKCCANCGAETVENLVEGLMTMDYPLFVEVESKKKPPFIEMLKAERWKSVIKTRLCQKCLNLYKTSAKTIIQRSCEEVAEEPPTKKSQLKESEECEEDSVSDEMEDDEEEDDEGEDEEGEDEEMEDEYLEPRRSTISHNPQPVIPVQYQYYEPHGSSSQSLRSTTQHQPNQNYQFQQDVYGYQQPQILQHYSHQNPQQLYANLYYTAAIQTKDTISSAYQPSSECPVSYILYDPTSTTTDDDLKNL